MIILLVQPLDYLRSIGGAHKANRLLMEGLASLGHRCIVIAPAMEAASIDQVQVLNNLKAQGITVRTVRPDAITYEHNGVLVYAVCGDVQTYIQLFKEITDAEDVTWVLVSEDRSYILIESILETTPDRVVLISHSQAVLPFGPESFIPDPFKAPLFKRFAGIITVSRYVQTYIKQWVNLDSTVIYFPSYGLGPFPNLGNFDSGYVAMVNPSHIKGISIFLELARRFPHISFAAVPTWATSDDDKAALRTLPNMHILKPQEDLNELFSQIKVLVVPSLWGESFGQIVVDAMLRGIPVLASNVGGLPEAKLGVEYVLPVNPIRSYVSSLDERGIPKPIIEEQDTLPWEMALHKLLSDRTHYEAISNASQEAALSFIKGLGIPAFERYIQNLQRLDINQRQSSTTEDVSTEEILQQIDALSPHRHALLALWLQQNRQKQEQATILPQPREHTTNRFPLSFAQQQLWLLDQIQPNNVQYNMVFAYRINGNLNITALSQSVSTVIARHEALRTTFVVIDGQPWQSVTPPTSVDIPVEVITALTEPERENAVASFIKGETLRPFNLAQDPLIRVKLAQLADNEYILVVTMHHIISDAWSFGIFLREINACYTAFTQNTTPSLSNLPIHFADFATWQRQQLQNERLQHQLAYWKQQLADAPPLLALPSDRPRPPVQTFRGSYYVSQLPSETHQRLKVLSRQEGTTLFMILLAAFQVLLYRYSGQPDIVVGSSIANRDRPETLGVIGFFVNTLVLRTRLTGAPTFRQVLHKVRDMALDAYIHQDVPFEKLVEELRPERNLSYNPLFQVFFVLQGVDIESLTLPGLNVTYLKHEGVKAMFDLTLSVSEGLHDLSTDWEYNSDLFDKATIVRMSQRFAQLLASIVQNPDALIDDLELDQTTHLPEIKPLISPQRKAPLSYHQERLWFIDLFETGVVYDTSPIYHNLPFILHLRGNIDIALLEASLNRVVTRHEALRTTISSEGEQFFQVVQPAQDTAIAIKRYSSDRERGSLNVEDIVAWAWSVAGQPFHLRTELPIRAMLLQISDDEAALAIVVHHIVADRHSLVLIARELFEIYRSTRMGQPVQLPHSPVHYLDFASWQRHLPEATMDSLRFYWKHQLRNKIQALELPESRPRPAIHTFTAARHSFTIEADITAKLHVYKQKYGDDLDVLLLAAFQVLLHRYSGLDEIVVGISEPCRILPELTQVVGPFANLLVIRNYLSSNPSFRDVITQVGRTLRQARAHQLMPFDRLVLELNPEKDMSRTALFDVLFHFEDQYQTVLSMDSLSVQMIDPNLGYGKYDLHLAIRRSDACLEATLIYNQDIYDHEFMVQMMRHFEVVLAAMVHNFDRPIGSFGLGNVVESKGSSFNTELLSVEVFAYQTLDQIFAAQAYQTPQNIAVVDDTTQLTYQELDARANQLAHYLIHQGVTVDVLVGICLDRSVEMIVAILAVLKAGGAYLPIDPSYPEDRMRFLLEDAGISQVITTSAAAEHINVDAVLQIKLDTDQDRIAAMPLSAPAPRSRSNSLAYCIYTSGSTGKPKGVLVEHQNAVQLMRNGCALFSFTSDDVWTLFHSYCFDFSVWEIWGALLFGGQLVIVPYLTSRSPEAFYELLCQKGVTVLNQTPSAFRQLVAVVEHIDAAIQPTALRLVIFGGEALELQSLRPWFERFGDQRPLLVNMYGITETTVHVTYRPLSQRDLEGIARSVIGSPIPDWQLYILDRYLQLAPVGVTGEMFVGGAGLSRGYLNRPELTASRFIPNTFSDIPNSRLYRSGDLARYLPNGDIEYLGRIDHQVKIRGFRIELGEIEAVLNQYPPVQTGVVIMQAGSSGEQRLVAYMVPRNKETLSVAGIRTFLTQHLPDYMVPATYVFLDALPLNNNGKLDRAALPEPGDIRPILGERFVGPRTPTEELLCQIWADILNITDVGVYDNFFALGGHSLLATQMITRIRSIFQLELPLRYIFESPTIAELSICLEGLRRAGVVEMAETIHPSPRPAQLPLSFAQQRLWFLDQMQPGLSVYNVPAAFRLYGKLDLSALTHSLTSLVARHESLRTTFAVVDGTPIQVIAAAQPFPLPVVDLRGLPPDEREAEVERRAMAEFRQPFDLAAGPLVRAQLLKIADEDHLFLISRHHTISDGWSDGLLFKELSQLYSEALYGVANTSLPPLPIQYADYALWQREWLQGEALTQQITYWKQHLTGALPLDLPTDFPRPPVQSFRGATQGFVIPADLTHQLNTWSRQQESTLFMVLLTTFTILLARYSNQFDIVIGTPIANRTRAELEPLIGLFINTLALRIDLSGGPSFEEATRRVREVCLNAYAHQDVPFEHLVDALGLARDLSRPPLFQVLFALQNTPAAGLELPHLEVEQRWFSYGMAKFDLSMTLTETANGLEGALEYSSDLFTAETITRMLGHFQTLLAAAVSQPQQPVLTLPMLTPAEQTQLAQFAAPHPAPPSSLLVPLAFAQQVARTPDACALSDGSQQLSFRGVYTRAARLAQQLVHLGVRPETHVALCCDRALDYVVALLAVWQAGGAAVPLDPSHPPARLAAILTDARPLVLITQPSVRANLPSPAGAAYHELCLSSDDLAPPAPDLVPPPVDLQPQHLAYLIYTSGSTGTPKAVLVEHRHLRHLLAATQQQFPFAPGDRMPWMAASTFDIAFFELWAPLLAGASVLLLRREQVLDLPALLSLLRGCTAVHAVPSLLQQIVQALQLQQRTFPQLRLVWVGGDTVPPALLPAAAQVFPQATLHVLYGPTEATILSSAARISPTAVPPYPVIGQPLPGVELSVRDALGELVPLGVPGELYIGGPGVARGYWQQPALTATRFSAGPQTRWYRSGDRVRWRPDGILEFLGRIDQQVKLRGFRIEVGEIEAVLQQHPQVQEGVVQLQTDAAGTARLVAYGVPHPSVDASAPTELATAWRQYLFSRLPDYMVPSAVLVLPALPLTRNGKVDRAALPRADFTAGANYVAPRTALETTLSQIWAEVLDHTPIGIHDNFFAIGGDSILSIRIISLARRVGLHITPRQIFQYQTIAELAQVVEIRVQKTADQGIVQGHAPLTPIQHHFFALDLPNAHHFNQALLLEVRQTIDFVILERSLQHILSHHDALRLRFRATSNSWEQFHAAPDTQSLLTQVDLQVVPVSEQAAELHKVATEIQSSLDLGQGPLVRAVLFRLGNGQMDRLLLVIHHLVVDTISWGIILSDLETVYTQLSQDQAVLLPSKTTSFQQWANQLQRYAADPSIFEDQQYWLQAIPAQIPPLPYDFINGANTIQSVDTVKAVLSVEETDLLLRVVPSVYQTQINDTLLTALVQAYAVWTGSSLVLVDLESHGREDLFDDVDLSRTVGWFTSIFPVALNLIGISGYGEALKAIKEQLRRIPRRGISYGILRYLSPNAEVRAMLQGNPSAEISFNYLGQMNQTLLSQMFVPTDEDIGATRNPEGMRNHVLEIDCHISAGQLHMAWYYSVNIHRRATIMQLAEYYMQALRALITHCQSPDAGGYTPSDFPDIDMSQDELDDLINQLSTNIEDDL